MIIETSANQYFRVQEIEDVSLSHLWTGIPVKKVRGQWIPKANAKPQLVRKIGTKKVEG